MPKFYKSAHICPLHKKDDRAKPKNYRPISMTSHIIKIFERILRQFMVAHLEENGLLTGAQHGFRSGRSTLTQLLAHFDFVFDGLRRDDDVDAIYLDYAKAFDKVDHRLLRMKLVKYGFHDSLIAWVDSFLSDRFQEVVVNEAHSYKCKIKSGVPQGTVLGPLLFIIFVNDLESVVKHSEISFYADDTRISKRISTLEDKEMLQSDLLTVMEWSKQNNMKLHEDKFQLMSYQSRMRLPADAVPFNSYLYSYTVGEDLQLFPSAHIRDLGVTISMSCSWLEQINKLVSKARDMASWVLSVFRARDRESMLTLYKSLVRSHIEYCSPLWHPSKVSEIQKLEGVQRFFTKRIEGVSHLTYWERLKQLNLMSLQRRRERYILIHVWKILYGLVPNDVKLKFREPSRLGIQAEVPALIRCSRLAVQSLYESSFAVVGPRLWNSLPSRLSVLDSLEIFKGHLTKFMLELPDEPPVVGYARRDTNTLSEVVLRRSRV